MSALHPHELTSPFFRLSPEMRLAVYHHLLPTDAICIDLCTPRRPEQANFVVRKRSVISTLLMQTLNLETISRENGLNLLLVSRRTNSEILPLLARTTVRFHCSKCFYELLNNFSHGLGVGVTWMKHVEIVLDLNQMMARGQTLTLEVGRAMARETMGIARKTGWLFYGRLDLSGREQWKYEVLREESQVGEGVEGDDQGAVQQQQLLMGPPPLPPSQHGPPLHHPANTWQQVANTNQVRPPPSKWLISARFDI